MSIEPVQPRSDQALRDWHDVDAAVSAADTPDVPCNPFEELVADIQDERRSVLSEYWLLRSGTRAVGAVRFALPMLDNLDVATVKLLVHPEHRRRGHGRELLAHVVRRAREHGRTRLVTEISEPLSLPHGEVSPGAAFATAAGARRALDEIRRVLDLAAASDAHIASLEDEARSHAPGYALLQWEAPTPDEVVDDFAALVAQMSTDAPLEDLAWEKEVWDRQRIREQERMLQRQFRRRFVTAVRHEADGRLVAFSDVAVSTLQPETAFQWDTIVLPDHRGHRLGMLVKAANLRRLRHDVPQAARVITWNAESNAHMVAINDAMGFRPVGRLAEWDLPLPPPDQNDGNTPP